MDQVLRTLLHKIAQQRHGWSRIGDSGALRVGELVLAVGNPLGLVRALSAGLVHAVGPRAIHADLRLAPGNSGGPLADARGHVVGKARRMRKKTHTPGSRQNCNRLDWGTGSHGGGDSPAWFRLPGPPFCPETDIVW